MKELFLLHGWDPAMYTSNLNGDEDISVAWKNRDKLIKELSKKFHINYYNLPGFCNRDIPQRTMNIKDFSIDFDNYYQSNPKKSDLIIGYSFGGVIALNHKVVTNHNIPIVLIAPAISRKYSIFSRIGSLSKNIVPMHLRDGLKHLYQLTFSKYYRQGDKVMQKSYDKIARMDSSYLINRAKNKNVLFIYGDCDSATPWNHVSSKIKKNNFDYVLINNGDHNIGQTHPEEIAESIFNFLNIK